MIAPNKQNLLLLKSQKKLVKNGHKLLKEKRAGLIINFLELAQKGKKLEQELSEGIQKVLDIYHKSITFTDTKKLIESLTKIPAMKLAVGKKKMSGVYITKLNIDVKKPEREDLKDDLRIGLNNFSKILPLVLQVSQLKLNCSKISTEITKTSRQISNLERKMDDIDQQSKFIRATLQEKENLEKATLIKIFN